MTNRDPNDLYDALRNRLADYGQEPPPTLWAGIRAQLPPPVAAPQRRRRMPAAWLALIALTLTAAGAGWYRWQVPHAATAGAMTSRTASHRFSSSAPRPGTPDPQTPAAASRVLPPPENTGQPLAVRPSSASRPAFGAGRGPADDAGAVSAGATGPVAAPGPVTAAARAARAAGGAAGSGPATAASRPDHWGEGRPETTQPDYPTSMAASRSMYALTAPNNRRRRHRPQPETVRAARPKPTAVQPLGRPATGSIADQPAMPTPPDPKATKGLDNPRTAPAPMLARPVAPWHAAPPERPVPLPVAAVPSPLARLFASRWAVQVVVGPALTYRYLNEAAGATAPTAPPVVYTPAFTPGATLEQPALGSAAQATVRRTLGRHWSLSAGLGYAEYASASTGQPVYTLATTLLPAIAPDTTGVRRRDTYRFATLPVRVGFGWTLSGRCRVGLLAGAEAAVYVGGQNPESPSFRRLSVGASLGAEVRYRLGAAGRWELLAQPTATYLLSPLARYTPYYQRHLWGSAALLGVALNLP